MKNYFGLTMKIFSESELIQTQTVAFSTAELRDMAKEYLENQNSTLGGNYRVEYRYYTMQVFEHMKEVPRHWCGVREIHKATDSSKDHR